MVAETEVPPLRIPSRLSKRAELLIEDGKRLLAQIVERNNNLEPGAGLTAFTYGLGPPGGLYGTIDTAALPYTLANANTAFPITLNRIELSMSYVNQGLIRTAIDQPVDDAFRGGINFKSGQLDEDDLQLLNRTFKKQRPRRSFKNSQIGRANIQAGYDLANSDQQACKQAMKWSRLFGGSGLLINTNQDYKRDLNVEAIGFDSPLMFIAADRWELMMSTASIWDETTPTPFNYYGLTVNRTRVIKILGDDPPSWYRQRLQGWALSFLEQIMRPLSASIKFERLLFELLDEAKVDVYGIANFNTSLASANGTALVQARIQLSNQLKNFQTALVMDKDDTYTQKNLGSLFNGLADIWDRIRLNLCAAAKMPENKLYGIATTGFGSGKDAQDNYNSTVEILRERADPMIDQVGDLRCQQLFGFIPDDLEHEWTPLAVLDGVEQETVKTSKQARIMEQFSTGLLDGQEASESLKKEELLLVDSAVLKGKRDAVPPLSVNPDEADQQHKHAVDLVKAKPQPKPAAKAK